MFKPKKKEKSSSYASASMLLPSSTSSSPIHFSTDEISPLNIDKQDNRFNNSDLDLNSDLNLQNLDPEQERLMGVNQNQNTSLSSSSSSEVKLPGIYKGKGKGVHKLSRKKRGYVAYSSKKDKNIRLTTVLETPIDDDLEFMDGDIGQAGEVEMTI